MAPEPLARSAGGLTVMCTGQTTWSGDASERSRRLDTDSDEHAMRVVLAAPAGGWGSRLVSRVGASTDVRVAAMAARPTIRHGEQVHSVFPCLSGPWRYTVFGALYAAEGTDRAVLERVAREFSPRIEVCGPREITLDLSGLERLFGDARTIAQELRRTAADRGLQVRVAIAGTRSAARLFVHFRAGITVIEPGSEAEMLASLPLSLLDVIAGSASMAQRDAAPGPQLPTPRSRNDPQSTPNDLADRHVATVGACARLASLRRCLRTKWRRGLGVRASSGSVSRVAKTSGRSCPAVPEERFEQTLDLEWPIEGLEPLSFVLGRLMEPLSAHLERRDRGAAVLHVRLHLVTRAVHERSLQLPAPMRDARALRTLALLDLESHPPGRGHRSGHRRRRSDARPRRAVLAAHASAAVAGTVVDADAHAWRR